MEDPIVDSEILHDGEGGDEKWWSNLKTIFFCVCDCLSLDLYLFTLLTLVLFFHVHILFIPCITFIILIYRFLLVSIRKQLSTLTHSLEEHRGEVLEPFMENSASLLILSDRFASFIIDYCYSIFD